MAEQMDERMVTHKQKQAFAIFIEAIKDGLELNKWYSVGFEFKLGPDKETVHIVDMKLEEVTES